MYVQMGLLFDFHRFKSIGAAKFKNPRQPVFTLDHDVQNKTEKVISLMQSRRIFQYRHNICQFKEPRKVCLHRTIRQNSRC